MFNTSLKKKGTGGKRDGRQSYLWAERYFQGEGFTTDTMATRDDLVTMGY